MRCLYFTGPHSAFATAALAALAWAEGATAGTLFEDHWVRLVR